MKPSVPKDGGASIRDNSAANAGAFHHDNRLSAPCWQLHWLVCRLAAAAIVLFLAIAGSATFWWPSLPAAEGPYFSGPPKASSDQKNQNGTAEILTYYDIATCTDCHTKGFLNPSANICRGIEYELWQGDDKHAIAYKVLGDDRAGKMGKLLGEWDVQNRPECLSCHGAWVDDKPGVVKEKDLKLNGVSCVACHGADLTKQTDKGKPPEAGWAEFHTSPSPARRDYWRKLPRESKQKDFGMTDLWNPAVRTKVCASCHIGNVLEGKVVTHEMYAAGHPPLPSFEVSTFSNQMPPHWQDLREKDEKIRSLVMQFAPINVKLEQTHLLAIGGLVVFREYLQMLVDTKTKNWPELANYSCSACHHELKSKSWRQEDRGYIGRPGSPAMLEWPAALVDLGLFHAAANADEAQKLREEFKGHVDALRKVLDAEPFGKQKDVKDQAYELVKWIGKQVDKIQERVKLDEKKGGYGEDASAKLLHHLQGLQKQSRPGAKGEGGLKPPVPDYHSARQLTWAYQVLRLESESKQDWELRKQLLKDLNNNEAWTKLDKYLGLKLPPGLKKLPLQTKLEPFFEEGLELIGKYDPKGYFKYLDDVIIPPKSPK